MVEELKWLRGCQRNFDQTGIVRCDGRSVMVGSSSNSRRVGG